MHAIKSSAQIRKIDNFTPLFFIVSRKGSLSCTTKPDSWFLDQGCHQVPIEKAKNYVRWGHPDGYFLKPNGLIAKDNYPPSQYVHKGGSCYPRLRECVNACHILMAYAFYGERPTYVNAKGKVKPYQAHHLNGDKFDYRPANILAWLHPDDHRIADARQKALREVVPDGDLNLFPYERLRELQDPRTMSDFEFQRELESIRAQDYRIDPGASSQRNGRSGFRLEGYDRMEWEMSHHMET